MYQTHFVLPDQNDPFEKQFKRTSVVKNPHHKIEDVSEIEDARQRQIGRKKLDQFTISLGQKFYIYKPRFPWLKKSHRWGSEEPLSVDRYYPPLKLLMDISVKNPADSEINIVLKQELAKANGFHYFNIKDVDDIFTVIMNLPSPGGA